MPHIENLLEGYRQFYQKYYIENPETYKNLTEKGRHRIRSSLHAAIPALIRPLF